MVSRRDSRGKGRGGSLALAALAAALLAACARPSVPVAPAPGGGMTAIVIEDHLPAPFEIEHVAVALDGAAIYVRDDDRGLKLSQNLAFRQKIPTGEHTLTLKLRVRTPCGLGSVPRLVHDLRAARSFTVGSDGGTFTVDVFSGGPLRIDDGPRVDYRASGSVREGGTFRYHFPECTGEPVMKRAVCTAERLALRARETKDLVWLSCIHTKKRAIVALSQGDDGDAAVRERRASDLELELHECRGFDIEITAPVVTVRDECGAVGALP